MFHFDSPASVGGRSTINDILSANDPGNLVGDQLEVRIAADRINNGETVEAIGRKASTTDVDIELNNGIIEAKSRILLDEAPKKLSNFESAAVAGDLRLDGKTVTFDSTDGLTDSAKSTVRQDARDIEARNNGINSIDIEFDSTSPVEVDTG